MPVFNIPVSSCGISINLFIDGTRQFIDDIKNEPFWYEHVTDFSFNSLGQPTSEWRIYEREALHFDYKKRIIECSSSTIKNAVVIIESHLEFLRQKNQSYTMHGSVLVRDGKAAGFIGNLSGIGKSTIAAYGSSRGWKWIADDKFTFNKMKVIGGTTRLLNDDKTTRATKNHNPSKAAHEYPLAIICQPIVTTESILTRHNMSKEKAFWTAYDEVSRDIRQVNGVVDTSLDVLQSSDNNLLSELRVKTSLELVETIPFVYLRGPKRLILKEVEAILSEAEYGYQQMEKLKS